VWHKRTHGTGTDADKFWNFYEALIGKLQAAGIRLVLCTPACIGEKTDCTNPQDGELNQYAQMIRDLAKQYKCGLCDFRTAFLSYNVEKNIENKDKGILTTDGVHLNDAGNALVAKMLLEKIRE
jgi:lysophospholipase L1-like esterase